MGEVSMGARWNHSRAANRRVACRPAKAVATSRPKLSTQPRPELRPQAGPEVRREPTRSPKLPRLCWCAARSIEAMHAPAVKLHHLAAQFYLTLAPTRHSTQLRPGPAFEIAHGADCSRTRPAPDLRACITHTHAACLALPCLRLRYPTLLLTNFRSRGLTPTFRFPSPRLQLPTATTIIIALVIRPHCPMRAPLDLCPHCIISSRCREAPGRRP